MVLKYLTIPCCVTKAWRTMNPRTTEVGRGREVLSKLALETNLTFLKQSGRLTLKFDRMKNLIRTWLRYATRTLR